MVIVGTESNTENLIHYRQWDQFSYTIISNRLPTQLVWPDMVAIRAAWTTSYLSTYFCVMLQIMEVVVSHLYWSVIGAREQSLTIWTEGQGSDRHGMPLVRYKLKLGFSKIRPPYWPRVCARAFSAPCQRLQWFRRSPRLPGTCRRRSRQAIRWTCLTRNFICKTHPG